MRNLLQKRIDEFLETKFSDITGCQERCPFCHNKCIEVAGPHVAHKTNCHLLTGFGGVSDKITNKVSLEHCLDPKNFTCKWYHGDEEFINLDALIDSKYPSWKIEFKTGDQTKREVPIEVKEAWLAIKDVLIKHHKYIDNTPEGWAIHEVAKERILDSKKVIPGYYHN